MYTRKEFLIGSAKQCVDFCRSCLSVSSMLEENRNANQGSTDHEPLFMEAMGLGIDPGTMDTNELSRTVARLKAEDMNERECKGNE